MTIVTYLFAIFFFFLPLGAPPSSSIIPTLRAATYPSLSCFVNPVSQLTCLDGGEA